jgi:uncharacterized protein (DUF885 family)
MNKFILVVCWIFLLTGCAAVRENRKPGLDVNGILEQYAKESYFFSPLSATANNINDYNDQLAINISKAFAQKYLAFTNRYLDTLRLIEYKNLPESEKLSLDILKYRLLIQNEMFTNLYGFYRPVDQFVYSFPQQFAVLGSGSGYVPFKTEKDYHNFMSRMKFFQVWVDQAISNMQVGLASNNTNPQASMKKVPLNLSLYLNWKERKTFFTNRSQFTGRNG